MAFVKATKSQSKLRLALCGLAGSGKTYSMLAIADGIAAEMRRLGHGAGRIAVIDTEHGSAQLYALTDEHQEAYGRLTVEAERQSFLRKHRAFDFDAMNLDNHSPRAYVEAIKEAETAGYDICIVDSLSHAWSGKNGALEQKDNAAARGGNSWTAWRDITPMHNLLIDTMLSCGMHLLASMRTKMEYVQTTTGGKTTIEKVGLAAIQREGMEYEFTCVGDVGLDHVLKISKSRLDGVLSLGDAFEKPGESFAGKIYGWLMSGAAPAPPRPVQAQQAAEPGATQAIVDALHAIGDAGTLEELDGLIPQLRILTGAALVEGRKRYAERKEWLTKELIKQQQSVPVEAAASPAPEAA